MTPFQRNRHLGITLIELLVVIIILVTLVAAVIPVMAPAVETRRIREAARIGRAQHTKLNSWDACTLFRGRH